MSGAASNYEATNRNRLDARAWEAAKGSYAFNYASILPERRDAGILDLGCSEGIALEWLVNEGYENVVGVDLDRMAIGYARERLRGKIPEESIVCADLLGYLREQEDGSVERVFMFNVIEHLEKSYVLETLNEVRRLLRPGGVFVAQTGNIENPFNFGLFARDFTHQIPFTINSFRQALLMSGFEAGEVAVKPVRYKPTLRNLPLRAAGPVVGWAVKGVALAMRIRIQETSPLIYCVARR